MSSLGMAVVASCGAIGSGWARWGRYEEIEDCMSELRKQILQEIYDTNQRLTPELVLDEASSESHPLHGYFDWDDSTAAYKFRLNQASHLIRSIRIVYRETAKGEAKSVRAWVAPRMRSEPHAYQPADIVAADPLMRSMVLRQMERDWKSMKERYHDFKEFWHLIESENTSESA